MNAQEWRDALGLRDGQFFAEFKYKNLQWFIKEGDTREQRIGYGDLQYDHIDHIQSVLWGTDYEFIGYNEHHGSDWQQFPHPMIKINAGGVQYYESCRIEWLAEDGLF